MRQVPLAHRLRPETLEEFFGQERMMEGEGRLREMILEDKVTSAIFYGPPGTGKSALAHIIAVRTSARVFRLNAAVDRMEELRGALKAAEEERERRCLLVIDEIHRFNKVQQEALLPYVEDGTVVLVGMTTENPYFFLSKALVSRSSVFEFRPLEPEALVRILERALSWYGRERGVEVVVGEGAREALLASASGDARRMLNLLELAVPAEARGRYELTAERVGQVAGRKAVVYDRDAEGHYDTISAFIKSVRGSDPDAALYWAAKMLEAGEPPEYLCRRLVILASEDIGNADPAALPLAMAAFEACRVVGMPEARIILAQAVTYCATAPKSNAAYLAIDAALEDVRKGRVMEVPEHLRDGNWYNREKFGRGKGYIYPHDHPWHYVRQDYLPEPRTYYRPSEMGFERTIRKRLEFWARLGREAGEGEEA